MKIGVRAHDYGKMPVDQLIVNIKQDGFSHIQLAIPKAIEGINSFDEITPELIQEIKKACKEHQVDISVFGCYIEPATLDEEKRKKELDKFLKSIEYAKELGAHCIGTETTRFSSEESQRERAFNNLVDSVSKMIDKAEEVGIDVGIEPVAYHTLATPRLTKRLLEEIDSPRLKIIFDPVNLITSKNITEQEKLWEECFEVFGDRICAVHLKGIKVDQNGELQKTTLHDSEIKLDFILKRLIKFYPNLHVLREEAIPDMASSDQEFIKNQL